MSAVCGPLRNDRLPASPPHVDIALRLLINRDSPACVAGRGWNPGPTNAGLDRPVGCNGKLCLINDLPCLVNILYETALVLCAVKKNRLDMCADFSR